MRTIDATVCYRTFLDELVCGRCLLNQSADDREGMVRTDEPASACVLDPCLTRADVYPLPPEEDEPQDGWPVLP